jgi:hypothetical protein
VNRTLKFIVILLCLCVAVPAAYAQRNCSLQTMVGTYAMHEVGASHFLDPTQQQYPLHFGGATAPFANVGLVTFKPNGIGNGYYWITVGQLDGGFDPIPVEVTITELNADCFGKFTYIANLPGNLSATVEERFVLFDNGREFRSLPRTIQNGIGTLAWIGSGYRISKSSEPPRFCGQQTAIGTYVLGIQNIIMDQPNIAIADTVLIREEISTTGHYRGKMFEKYADHPPVETWVKGKVTVNPDCSFSSRLQIPEYYVDILGKGVFFNQGKEFYMLVPGDPALPLDQQWLRYSFVYGKRVGP